MGTSNIYEIMDRCPERIETPCVYRDELPASNNIPRAVFYAYSNGNADDSSRKTLTISLREEIESIVKRENMGFSEYTSESQFSIRCEGICRRIQNSGILIADITPIVNRDGLIFSPNVLFELGVAWGNRREIILVSTEEIEMPSVLKDLKYFIYPNDFNNGSFVNHLRKAVRHCSIFRTGIKIVSTMNDALEAMVTAENMIDDYRLCCAYPSFNYRCEESALDYVNNTYMGESERRIRFEQLINRIKLFNAQISKAKDRSITFYELYHKHSFENTFKTGTFKNGPEKALDIDLRCKDLKNMINLYNLYYPHLKVRFMDEPLAYNWMMRPKSVIYIDGHYRVKGGLCGIVITNRESLNEFGKDFKRLWLSCEPINNEKDYINTYLNNLLKEIKNVSKENTD